MASKAKKVQNELMYPRYVSSKPNVNALYYPNRSYNNQYICKREANMGALLII